MFENTPTQPDSNNKRDATQENNDVEEKDSDVQMTRRGFLKLAARVGASLTVGCGIGYAAREIVDNLNNVDIDSKKFKKVEDDFWLTIIEDISRQTDEELTPQDIRAHFITKLFGIPQGWTSGLSTEQENKSDENIEQKRLHPKLDQLIATYFTNKTVAVTELEGQTVISTDFRDFRDIDNTLEVFREEVEKMDSGRELGMKIYSILKKEYDYLQDIYEKNKNIPESEITSIMRDEAVEFDYLPGGVPVFLRGYCHTKEWQSEHGKRLANTYKDADYIAIEGFNNKSFGNSLELHWSTVSAQEGDYDQLMKDLVREGFEGIFLEVDARDGTKVLLDSYFDKKGHLHQVSLPDIFYEHYFLYLKRENARFAKKIGTAQKLKQFMLAQTTATPNIPNAAAKGISMGKIYDESFSVTSDLENSTLPTGNELGQRAFTDAMSALKLHILAQNMNEGNIKKGIVVDFEGSNHLSMKSFYLKYPQYAAEIVLRTVHELMAGYMGDDLSVSEMQQGKNKPQNLQRTQEMLNEPPWFDIIQEIKRIPMAYVENDPNKTVEIGLNQKKMKKYNKLDAGTLEGLDTSVIWALFDDEYIQAHIDGTKSYVNQKNNEQ